ncbi:MAG: hypothetical protein PHQ28_15115 [Mycobacterium sp.]|nr:hypothetical protein [Mycobacterium sp.]
MVEGDADRTLGAERLAAQTLTPPERFVVERHALDDRSHGHALGELVAGGRQRRCVVDAAGERGVNGHDHPPGVQVVAMADDDGDAVVVVADARHRAAEERAITQLSGQPGGEQVRAAEDAVLLGAAAGADQIVEAAAGVDVEPRRPW